MKLPGIFVDTLGGILLGAAIIGLANAAVRPVLSFFSMPFNKVTLGGLTVAANVFTPLMVVKTLPGYQISSVVSPVVGIFLMTMCSCALSKVIQDR